MVDQRTPVGLANKHSKMTLFALLVRFVLGTAFFFVAVRFGVLRKAKNVAKSELSTYLERC